jgi:hypothetical protein
VAIGDADVDATAIGEAPVAQPAIHSKYLHGKVKNTVYSRITCIY